MWMTFVVCRVDNGPKIVKYFPEVVEPTRVIQGQEVVEPTLQGKKSLITLPSH